MTTDISPVTDVSNIAGIKRPHSSSTLSKSRSKNEKEQESYSNYVLIKHTIRNKKEHLLIKREYVLHINPRRKKSKDEEKEVQVIT